MSAEVVKGFQAKAHISLAAARALTDLGYHGFAVSRAYYAMFYVAKALLLDRGLHYNKHATVIAGFGQHLANPGHVPVHLHRWLIDAEKKRNKGDYDLPGEVVELDARDVLDWAQQFLDLAEQMLGPLPPLAEEQAE